VRSEASPAIVHIHRGIDRERGGTKGTKSGLARRFGIEPAILPLLSAMRKEQCGTGRVIRKMPRMRDLAEGLRNFLTLAGVTRAELHTTDRTRKALTWHDLRATGITWMAIRGDDALHIQHRAGHSSFSTTQGNIRQAEAVREAFGSVFPALDMLIETTERSNERSNLAPLQSWRRGIYSRNSAERAGFEPAPETSAKALENKAVLARDTATVSAAPATARHRSTPADTSVATAAASPARLLPASDVELERAIVEAVTAGAFDVARVLAAQLEDRRRAAVPSNVVPLRGRVDSQA
jgi:hypothetical protein